MNLSKSTWNMKKVVGASVLGVMILGGGIFTAMSVTSIEQGHVGVVYNRGYGIEKETLGQGWHWVAPWKRVTAYPISTATVNVDKFNVQTKDGKPLTVSLSYDYANDVDKLPAIYNKFKGQSPDVTENGWLQTRIKKATLNVFSNYSVLEVFQHQGDINAKIEKEFKAMVTNTGFLVDSVTLEAPKPDANTAKAIQGVVDAQQNLEKAEIEKKQATITAEKLIEEARGKAESNRIVKESLTPELLESKKIEKWNGEVPKVQGSGGNMLQLPSDILK